MDKSDSAYKTIGEVAKILNLKSNERGAPLSLDLRFNILATSPIVL